MQGRRLAANIMTLSILPMDAVELVIVSVLFGVLILWRIYLKKFRMMRSQFRNRIRSLRTG